MQPINYSRNSHGFSNQNKTSSKDSRENPGAIGAQPSRLHPNVGTKPTDRHDNVPMNKRKEYDAKYSSGKSDAKKSAGLPQGTADHK